MRPRLLLVLPLLTVGLLCSCDSSSNSTAPTAPQTQQDPNLIVWADYQYKPTASSDYMVVSCFQGTPASCDTLTAADSQYATRDTVLADSTSHRWTFNMNLQALKYSMIKLKDSTYYSSAKGTVHVPVRILDMVSFRDGLTISPISIISGGQWEGGGTGSLSVFYGSKMTTGTEAWSLSRTFVKVPTGLSIGTAQFSDVIMVTSSNQFARTTSSGNSTRTETLISYYAKGIGLIKETGTRGTSTVNRIIKSVKEGDKQVLSTQ